MLATEEVRTGVAAGFCRSAPIGYCLRHNQDPQLLAACKEATLSGLSVTEKVDERGRTCVLIIRHERAGSRIRSYGRERVVTDSGAAVSRFLITVLR